MINLRNAMNVTSDLIVTSAFTAAVGYLAARVFTSINPLHGAIYCGVASLISRAVSPLFEKLFSGEGANNSSKILGEIVSIGSIVVLSSLVSTAAGFSVPYITGVYLLAIMVGTAAMLRIGDFALEVASEAVYG